MSETKQAGMRLIGMVAENYKRLRLIEIAPKGRVVTFSGKPDQGKTSCVDAFLSAIGGKRSTQEMPVRKGAKNAKIRLVLGASKTEWSVQRTIAADGTHSLVLTDAKGQPQGRGQSILDELHGDIWMDPTQFIRMKPKEQVEILRKVSRLEIDVDAINAENEADYKQRTIVGREVSQLEAELSGMTTQEGLPAEKVDESEILAQLVDVGRLNDEARKADAAKQDLGQRSAESDRKLLGIQGSIRSAEARIENLKVELEAAEGVLRVWRDEFTAYEPINIKAAQDYLNAPDGLFADPATLTASLLRAQMTNREIDKQQRREAKKGELNGERRKVEALTRAIENRNERKAAALAAAKMPVEGLTFDDETVLMRGVPLAQLGDSEQMRICARIAMAENPKLRVLPIMHGESLGEEGIAMLAEMAEEHDFQILMAIVDESGKRGYVIEDGMIKTENE